MTSFCLVLSAYQVKPSCWFISWLGSTGKQGALFKLLQPDLLFLRPYFTCFFNVNVIANDACSVGCGLVSRQMSSGWELVLSVHKSVFGWDTEPISSGTAEHRCVTECVNGYHSQGTASTLDFSLRYQCTATSGWMDVISVVKCFVVSVDMKGGMKMPVHFPLSKTINFFLLLYLPHVFFSIICT